MSRSPARCARQERTIWCSWSFHTLAMFKGRQISNGRTADRQIRALEDGGEEFDAKAGTFHRIDVAVLDHRHDGDELVVPTLVEGAHRLLDQGIRLAERG